VTAILHELADIAAVQLPENPPSDYRPITWTQARQLESDVVSFAPHSVTHNILSRLDDSRLEAEIKHSWQTISAELENPLKVFCYPTGRQEDYGQREIDVLK